jgi:hypothetical protein
MPAGDVTLVDYRHPTARFALALPDGWDLIEEMEGIALVALEPRSAAGFQANLVVTIERLAPGMTLDNWAAAAIDQLPDHLAYWQMIDQEPATGNGPPGHRILAHHVVDGRIAVTMEQWLRVESQLGYTITASVGTADYGRLARLFATVAAGFRPDPELAV